MKVCAGRISSRYGPRTHPISGQKDKFHNGVDIAAPTGTPVYSPVDGTATLVATGPVGGKQIHIRNGAYEYHFLHLSEQLVKHGAQVSKGALIGKVGATGQVTGPHLHYGVKFNGQFINPEPFINF